ncbi:hypothetical protein [Roseibium sp.]|uniref:hypothetical protein n=1 Tax=Roseibium sp. TaxID=1936156 RepID=UPI003BAAE9C6
MEQFLTWLPALPVLMVLNRIRGGGMSSLTDRLPGRALYYVSMIIGGLTASILDPVLGAIVALGFLIWGAPGWGLWFDLGHEDAMQAGDPRNDDLFVKVVEFIAFGSDHVAMFLRLGAFVAPVLAAWQYLEGASPWICAAAAPFGLLGVGAYMLRYRTTWGNTLSELLIGLLWWALILFMALMR